MIDTQQRKRIDEIVAELAELHAKDGQLIQHRPSNNNEPVVAIPIDELFNYRTRYDRRRVLHEELRTILASRSQ